MAEFCLFRGQKMDDEPGTVAQDANELQLIYF